MAAAITAALLHADETTGKPFLTAGPIYAEAGLFVLPLRPGWRTPLVKWGRAATNDPASPLFGHHASAGIGIACKPSGLLVVDLDIKHPEPDGTTGIDRWNRLSVEHDPEHAPYYDRTTVISTPSRGLHIWFRDDHGTPGRDAFLPGVDIKAAQGTYGGFVVAPPTLGSNGRRYEVLGVKEPLPVPAWLREMLRPAPRPVAPSFRIARPTGDVGGIVGWLAGVEPGNQGGALYWTALALRDEGLSPQEAGDLLWPVVSAWPCSREPWAASDVQKCLRSAYRGAA